MNWIIKPIKNLIIPEIVEDVDNFLMNRKYMLEKEII